MEKMSTGILGLDKILGGYPSGKCILVTGSAGSGKTILALHLIQKSCSEGKKCNYVAIEETREDLMLQASRFGWDFSRYEEAGLLNIIQVLEDRMVEAKYQFDYFGSETGFGGLLDALEGDTEIAVIDNLGVLSLDMTLSQFRQQLDFLVYSLSKRGCTSIIISDETLMKDKKEVALYSVHGAIRLMKRDNPYTDSRERAMEIVKMRSTAVPIEYIVYDIGKDGIKILQ
jgi:KaiC/GvpD/RAD55 family RecA-like ATPase